jgi:REP element-mobilizing transposase RayT
VTFVTRGRRKIFLDAAVAAACSLSLVDARNWQRSRLLAWVLMPDHWHGVIELGDGDDLSHHVRRIKACSAKDVRSAIPGIPVVWQRGFHDHALRAEEDLIEMVRYVLLNPVRAGLVRRIGDYDFWDSAWRDS